MVRTDQLANFSSILLWDDGGRAMDRRRLGAFLALFKVESDVSAVAQFIECETLQRVFVKVHLATALLEDESVSLLREQFADYASKWRDRRRAYLGATPLFAVLAEFDGYGVEGGSDGLFERLVFFAGRHGMATRERDDDERLGDVGQLFVVEIFREGDSSMDQILMSQLEVCHAGLNLTFPAGSHPNVSTFNCQLHAASSSCSFGLSGLSGLFGLSGLSGFLVE
jgi:hypothetical protein